MNNGNGQKVTETRDIEEGGGTTEPVNQTLGERSEVSRMPSTPEVRGQVYRHGP